MVQQGGPTRYLSWLLHKFNPFNGIGLRRFLLQQGMQKKKPGMSSGTQGFMGSFSWELPILLSYAPSWTQRFLHISYENSFVMWVPNAMSSSHGWEWFFHHHLSKWCSDWGAWSNPYYPCCFSWETYGPRRTKGVMFHHFSRDISWDFTKKKSMRNHDLLEIHNDIII